MGSDPAMGAEPHCGTGTRSESYTYLKTGTHFESITYACTILSDAGMTGRRSN